MPSIAAFHHLSLTVTDLARSAEWYGRVLGFAVDSDVEGQGFCRFRLRHPDSGVTVTLTQHEAGPADRFDERRTGLDHVAFLVGDPRDVEAWKQRFEELGVDHSEIKPAGRQPGASAIITVRDPDNIQLEVFVPGG